MFQVRVRGESLFDIWYDILMEKQKDNLVHYRTSVCNINYHIVWSVKYRRKVLTRAVEEDLRQVIFDTAIENHFRVQLCEVGEADHVHCFVTAPPTLSVTQIVKYLKGISARRLFILHPEIREKLWHGVLWNHSYYAETIGSISEDTIRRYIEKQKDQY